MVDAFCASCGDVHPHAVHADDLSSCFCARCGTCQLLVQPLAPARRKEPGVSQRAKVPFRTRTRLWQDADLAGGIALLAEALQQHAGGDAPHELRETCGLLCSSARALQRRLGDPGGPPGHSTLVRGMPQPRSPRRRAMLRSSAT